MQVQNFTVNSYVKKTIMSDEAEEEKRNPLSMLDHYYSPAKHQPKFYVKIDQRKN